MSIRPCNEESARRKVEHHANELPLKYGCNPNQKPSRIFMQDGGELPIEVLERPAPATSIFWTPSTAGSWCKELKSATGPARGRLLQACQPCRRGGGPAPVATPCSKIYFVEDMEPLSPLACAYARARGADRMSSFGDWIALSDVCDLETATLIKPGGVRRHHRPRLHPGGPGDPQGQAQGWLQRGADRSRTTVPRPWSKRTCSA